MKILVYLILIISFSYSNSCFQCVSYKLSRGLYHHHYSYGILSSNVNIRKIEPSYKLRRGLTKYSNAIDVNTFMLINNDNMIDEKVNNDNDNNDDNNDDNDDNNSLKDTMIEWIKWYKRTLSPMMPPNCRFLPTCSSYGIDSIEKYGPWKGGILTAWRIMRCNPFGGSGYDPPQWPPPSFRAGSNTKRFF